MIEPTEADIGRSVIYTGGPKPERGVITSFNERYVFVRYGDPPGYGDGPGGGLATSRENLEWADARHRERRRA